MKSHDFTIYDMIVRNADLYPAESALVYGEKRTSFGEYRELCDRCATGLLGQGIGVGDRIAVLSSNRDEFLILCGAAAKIGAVVVPVNCRLSEGEIGYILRDSTPKLLFSSKEFSELARKASSLVGSIRNLYGFQTKNLGKDIIPFEKILLNEKVERMGSVVADHPFLIIHTAAVGGKPRGCVLSQSNMLMTGLQTAQMFRLTSTDCHICILPLFHIGGLSMTLAVMHQGGKNLIMDRFDPLAVLQATEKERGTFLGSFPPILGGILDVQEKNQFDISTLRGVGGIDSPEMIQRFLKKNPQAVFYNVFGQTEAMPVSGCDVARKPGSIGPPAILTRVAIFDDDDQEMESGAQGEICVRSPSVFLGYWNLEAETARVFRNGWHHTGDLGCIDQDGFLWYAGRKPEKELIKPGGENVYPAEVEETILGHGAIQEVCVFGVPDPEWGEAVQAVCVLKKGMGLSAEELIDFVGLRIARYKKPKHVIFVDSLPKKPSGSINREEIKKIYSVKT